MLVRRKRSRLEAFPQEFIVEQGQKNSKCHLIASGIKSEDFNSSVTNLISKRSEKARKDAALERARQQNTIERVKGRHELRHALRATKILELNDRNGNTHFTGFDAAMDRAIYDAFHTNEFSGLFELLDSGRTDINTSRQADGTTALMAACYHGNVDVARRLLERGADPDHIDRLGNSPRTFTERIVEERTKNTLRSLLDEYEFVIDLYEMDDSEIAGQDLPRISAQQSGMLIYDENTGEFLELVHDVDDADFGRFGGEDSDSNSEGYYERHMYDEDEYLSNDDNDLDYDECHDGSCKLDAKLNRSSGHRVYDADFERQLAQDQEMSD